MSSDAQIQAHPRTAPIVRIVDALARGAATFRIWRDRTRQRSQLERLTDRDLRDIGISRLDAAGEFRKPFWRA